MNIAPCNSTSFGSLVLANKAETIKNLSKIGSSPKVYAQIKDTFETLHKNSGSDILVLETENNEPTANNRYEGVTLKLYQAGNQSAPNTVKIALSEEDDSIVKKIKSLEHMDGFKISGFSYSNLVDNYLRVNTKD